MAIDRSSGNIAIESFILGSDAHNWQHEFIKDDATPYCDIAHKKICSPIFGTIINEHDDMMVRGKNEHEAAHARLTPGDKDPKWSRLKANVVNALEDLRIERAVSKLSPMIEKDLHGMNQELNRSLNLKLSQEGGKQIKPVDEAILAMMFRENGLSICWNISESAQKYMDAAYPEFQKWRDIRNADTKAGFYEIEQIADKVVAALEEAAKEQNRQEQEQQNQKNQKNNQQNQQNQQSGSSSEQQGESSDDNSGEGDSESSQDKNGKNKSSKKSDKKDNKDNSKDENEEENSGTGDEEDGEEENSYNQDGEEEDNGDDKENAEDSKGNGKDKDTDDNADNNGDEDGDSEEDGKGDADDSEEDGDNCNSSDSDGDEDGDADNQQGGNENSDSDSENSDSDNTSDNMDGDDNENSKPQSEVFSGDNNTKELKANDKKEQEKARERLEKDFGDEDVLNEELSEKMQKILEDSKKISSGYTSFTANDVIIKGEERKESFERARKSISSIVGQLSNYTEDAIKALSRVQMQRNLEHGKIDRRKLVGLSKSLTKKVFYKSKPGIDLNTAITIMIDESGSIGSMCHQLRSLAIAFSEVFTKLNIRFEVLGYTTHDCVRYNTPKNVTRTAPIKIIEHKTYGETYQQAKYRLGSISSDYCNIDGESLLIAYKRIARERVNRRIIFVLSDGLPNQGYNGYSITKHLYDAINFIRKNGTEVYGFGIGTNEPQKFYGKENFLYLKNISELGTAFFRRFREIVAR